MNLGHLRTILWLRWRLAANQINKQSLFSRVLLWVIVAGAALMGVSSLLTTIGLSELLLPKEWSIVQPLIWDGVILVFLSSWLFGVLNDLQRTEALSLDKFLHLPVSPRGVFVLNYLSSLLTLTAVAFLPLMIGLSFAMVRRYGPGLWGGVALVFCFLLMVTAVTFQFRGWLALLMQDKRRRRWLVTMVAVVLVSLSQIPLIIDLTLLKSDERTAVRDREKSDRQAIATQLEEGQISAEEARERTRELNARISQRKQAEVQQLVWVSEQANRLFPPLWLAGGIDSLGQGKPWGGVWAGVGMLAIAGLSLQRSYRTTLRLYRGEGGTPRPQPASAERSLELGTAGAASPGKPAANWLEWQVPNLSEPQAAVMLMTLRNMLRAPEAKLALVAPILAVFLLGGVMLFRGRGEVAEWMRPLAAIGSSFVAMAGVSQLLQNQFGFDRDGFRALLLAPVREEDLLYGKNAATAPLAVGLAVMALLAQQVALPMPWTHFAASLFQIGTMYLVACLVGNLMSIMTPLGIASGSLKPVNFKLGTIALQFLLFFLAPLAMIPAVAPLGAEWLAERFGWLSGVPLYLLGAAFYLVIVLLVYRPIIRWQADLLRARKWHVLETVTNVGS